MFKPKFAFNFLRFITEPTEGGADETPYEEMTAEQKLAFLEGDRDKWKAMSKKHEKNRKPATYDSDMQELAKLRANRDDSLEPDEKALNAVLESARAEGRDSGVAELLKPAVRASFKSLAPHLSEEELDEFLEDIDVTPERFYADGELNVERIERLAKRIAKPADEAEGEDSGEKPGRTFNLGHIVNGDSRGSKKLEGNPRAEAYERAKQRFSPANK